MRFTRPARPLASLGALVATGGLMIGLNAAPAFATPGGAGSSNAGAQAAYLNLQLLNLNLQASSPPTTSTNTGNGGNASATVTKVNHANQPAVSLLSGETFLTAGALSEQTEADSNGTSFACAGVVAPGGTVQVGTQTTPCTLAGNGGGGLTLDLNKLLGTNVTGGLATNLGLLNISLKLNAITAFASQTFDGMGNPVLTRTGGVLCDGNGNFGTLTLGLLGILNQTNQTVNLACPAGGIVPNSNLLPIVVGGVIQAINQILGLQGSTGLLSGLLGGGGLLGGLGLNGVVSALNGLTGTGTGGLLNGTAGLNSLLTLEADYQYNTPDPSLVAANAPQPVFAVGDPAAVTGLHITLLGTTLVINLATAAVGPNVAPGAIVPPGPAFPTKGLPYAGATALLGLLGLGAYWRRRSATLRSAQG